MSSLKHNKSINNKSDKITKTTTTTEKNCNCSTPSGSFLYPGRVSATLPPSTVNNKKYHNNSSLDQSTIRGVLSTDSIPFADADTPPRGEMTSRWTSETSSSSNSSFEADVENNIASSNNTASSATTTAGGVHFPDSDDQVTDCCSLNNLLDALESEGDGVSGAFSFSTLLSVSQEDMASGSDKLFDQDDHNNSKLINKGHNTLPRSIQQQARNSFRNNITPTITSPTVHDQINNTLIPNNIYYYCPTTSNNNNNNGNVHNNTTRSPQNYQQQSRVTSPHATMARPTNYGIRNTDNNNTSIDKVRTIEHIIKS